MQQCIFKIFILSDKLRWYSGDFRSVAAICYLEIMVENISPLSITVKQVLDYMNKIFVKLPSWRTKLWHWFLSSPKKCEFLAFFARQTQFTCLFHSIEVLTGPNRNWGVVKFKTHRLSEGNFRIWCNSSGLVRIGGFSLASITELKKRDTALTNLKMIAHGKCFLVTA